MIYLLFSLSQKSEIKAYDDSLFSHEVERFIRKAGFWSLLCYFRSFWISCGQNSNLFRLPFFDHLWLSYRHLSFPCFLAPLETIPTRTTTFALLIASQHKTSLPYSSASYYKATKVSKVVDTLSNSILIILLSNRGGR